jgi:hypothetical protein
VNLLKKSKYGSRKIVRNGVKYDSIKECKRYCELSLLERAGAITDLQRQVPFELIPAQYKEIPTGELYKRGERKGQPKMKRVCVEQSVVYNADFVYYENGKKVVEDTKSKATKTKDYVIKRKLMLYIHNIKINEV